VRYPTIPNNTNKITKHDSFMMELCKELELQYDSIQTNIILYSKKRRRVAEIDILACKDGKCDIYEVKCSYRFTKAKKQLKKLRRLVPNVKNTFFYCGLTKELVII
jgi:hypothetical protein